VEDVVPTAIYIKVSLNDKIEEILKFKEEEVKGVSKNYLINDMIKHWFEEFGDKILASHKANQQKISQNQTNTFI